MILRTCPCQSSKMQGVRRGEMAMLGDLGVVTRVRPGAIRGARGRGAWGADFAQGREARGAGLRPHAPLPTLEGARERGSEGGREEGREVLQLLSE